MVRAAGLILLSFAALCPTHSGGTAAAHARVQLAADVAVFCATPAGVSAAIAAARAALPALPRVLLLEPSSFVGAMATSGIGLRDGGVPETIGGLAREWAMLNAAAFNTSAPVWQPDNFVGEESFRVLLAGAPNVQLLPRAALSGGTAAKSRTTVLSLPLLLNGTEPADVTARVFVDACYEGDLLALSMQRSSWTFGREARTAYAEPLAGAGEGIVDGGQNVGLPASNMSAYDDAGVLFDFVAPASAAPQPGAGDSLLQAAQFRVCVTQDAAIRVPFPRPPLYNATKFRALAAWARQGYVAPPTLAQLVGLGGGYGRRGNKRDPVAQYNTFGLDAPGLLVHAPTGLSYAETLPSSRERADIVAAHVDYTLGWLYTLANDVNVPPATRASVGSYGLCGDEWASADPPHFPPQLYVREARRLVGDAVLTQADAQPGRTAPASVGVASWFVDSHDVQRYASGPPPAGVVVTEGCLNREANETAPPVCDTSGKWWPKPFFAYEVPYSVMLPPRADTANVLVPVAVSASHVAFQTLRLEPTWAVLGQAAGAAAALALAAAPRGAPVDVHSVDVVRLQQTLAAQGAVVFLPPPAAAAGDSVARASKQRTR
jgi:hypothetical protein